MIRNIVDNDWFTVSIVLCIVFIAITKLLYANKFNDFVKIIGNSNYLKIYIKDQKFVNLFDGLLFVNLVISASIFVLILNNQFQGYPKSIDIMLFLKLAVGISSILIIKALIDRLIGSLFEIDELINDYVFQKITYKNYLGLILLPVNILLIYVLNISEAILYIVIFVLFVVNCLGFLESLKTHLNIVKSNLFYFILYLCALEIAPYIILYKLLIN